MRTVLVHIHLFKNAGTSVEQSLRTYFGDNWVSFDKNISAARISQTELRDFLVERPEIQAVSSHQVRPPLDDMSDLQILPIVFLRHPIDRIRSAYEFERNQGAVSPSSRAASSMNFLDWVEFHRRRRLSQARNFQTFALTTLRNAAGAPMLELPTEVHLARARTFVEGLPAFGLVESFEHSWEWISEWIRCYFPDFSAPTRRANAGATDVAQTLEERLAELRRTIGAVEYERLMRENEADLELYAWASSRARASFEPE